MRLPLAIFAILGAGCSSNPPDVPTWPKPDDVEQITATVLESVQGESAIAEFAIPREYVNAILRVLSPLEYHKHSKNPLHQIGQIQIKCWDGRRLDVRLIFDGKSPALFTVNGVECIRGGQYNDIKPPYEHYLPESLNIEGFLRAVHRGEPISA